MLGSRKFTQTVIKSNYKKDQKSEELPPHTLKKHNNIKNKINKKQSDIYTNLTETISKRGKDIWEKPSKLN